MNKKHVLKATLASLTIGILLALPATAAQTLNWGKELNPSKCDHKKGPPVILVTQKVINDVDSGVGGNNWAFDHYTRIIQVWAQVNGDYCAIVTYTGRFDAQAGQASPGNTGILDGDEDGVMLGGYRATVTSSLLASPLWKTHGNVGTFDYQCGLDGNCLGYVSWVGQYFDGGYTFDYDWWGWIYHAGKHGTWVNSSDGNSGDIL